MTFRFLGTEGTINDIDVDRFGEKIELSEAIGMAAIAGAPNTPGSGFPMLPDEDFETCGFTADELDQYAYPGPRSEAPEEFNQKWLAARTLLHELRESLKAAPVAEKGE